MKTQLAISGAISKVRQTLAMPGLNAEQLALFAGMLNALSWVVESPHGSTLERLINGEPVAAGKDPTGAIERLESISRKVGGP